MHTSKIQNAARIFLGALLTFTGVSHLTFNRAEFLAQVPKWLPVNPDFVVVTSGLVEIGLGLALIFAIKYKNRVGLITAAFFVLIFPGNISQYLNHVNAFGLDTDKARLIRLFFQPILILWALWSTNAFSKSSNNYTIKKS